jgi:hypothetical protein
MRNPEVSQIEKRLDRAELRLHCSVDQRADTRLHDGADTHHTRLYSDVERRACNSVVTKLASRLADRDELGVGGRVDGVNRLVKTYRDHVLVSGQNRPNGNFAQVERMSRLRKRATHHSLLGPDCPSPRSASRILDSVRVRKAWCAFHREIC